MRLLASAALLLIVALTAAGAATAAQDAANARAKGAAALVAEVGQLRAKISSLGAFAVYIGSSSPRRRSPCTSLPWLAGFS
jgi:hypothetical protein